MLYSCTHMAIVGFKGLMNQNTDCVLKSNYSTVEWNCELTALVGTNTVMSHFTHELSESNHR